MKTNAEDLQVGYICNGRKVVLVDATNLLDVMVWYEDGEPKAYFKGTILEVERIEG